MPTLADTNYNPGNLRDVTTGNFRQFNSEGEGYAALMNDLQGKVTGNTRTGLNGSSSLYDFAQKYAPSGDNNNPAQYTANLANSLGVRPDTKLSELQSRIPDFAQAIAKNEGYTAAKGFKAVPKPQTQTPPPAPVEPSKPSVGGFLGNVLSSGANAIGGIASAVAHPIKTVEALGNTAVGGIEAGIKGAGDLLTGGKYTANGGAGMPKTNEENQWDAFTGMLKDRYGSLDAVKNTLYKDPVGAAMDIASVLEGGAGLVGKGAEALKLGELGKAAELGKAGEVVRPAVEASGLAGAAQKVSEVAKEANPINLAGKAVGAVASKVGDIGEGLPGKIAGTAFKDKLGEVKKNIVYGNETLGEKAVRLGYKGTNNQIFQKAGANLDKEEDVLQGILDKTPGEITRNDIIYNPHITEILDTAKKTPGMGRQVETLNRVLQEIPDKMTIPESNVIKRNLYTALGDKSYALDATTAMEKTAQKAVARAIKETIEQKSVGTAGEGVVKQINENLRDHGKIRDAALNNLAKGKNPLSLGFKDVMTMGAGGLLHGTGGAVGMEAASKVLGTTFAKTWSAFLLSRVSRAMSGLTPELIKSVVPHLAKYSASALQKMSDPALMTLIKDIASAQNQNPSSSPQ